MNYESMFEIQVRSLGPIIGRTILSLSINTNKTLVLLNTDKGPLFLSAVAQCCAKAYIAHISGIANLINAKVQAVHVKEWEQTPDSNRDECNVKETMGITIITTKGHVDVETRLEHNGYYGGWLELDTNKFLDEYGDAYDLEGEVFIPMLTEDF